MNELSYYHQYHKQSILDLSFQSYYPFSSLDCRLQVCFHKIYFPHFGLQYWLKENHPGRNLLSIRLRSHHYKQSKPNNN